MKRLESMIVRPIGAIGEKVLGATLPARTVPLVQVRSMSDQIDVQGLMHHDVDLILKDGSRMSSAEAGSLVQRIATQNLE